MTLLSSTKVNTQFTTVVNISATSSWASGVLRLEDVMEAWRFHQTSEAKINSNLLTSTNLISTTGRMNTKKIHMIQRNMGVKVLSLRTATIVSRTESKKGRIRAGNAVDLVPETAIDAIFKLNLE